MEQALFNCSIQKWSPFTFLNGCYLFPQILFKVPYSAGYIWCGDLNNCLVWYFFIQCHSLLPCIILPFFFLVLNIAMFVTPEFYYFWHSSLWSQTTWANMTHVDRDYNQFPPTLLNNITKDWSLGVLVVNEIKGFLGGLYHAWFLVCIFEPVFFLLFQQTKISCGPGLFIEIICWPTSSSPDSSKIPFDFIKVDGGERCSLISVFLYLDVVACPHIIYNWVYHCFLFVSTLVRYHYCYDSYRLN